MTRPSIPTPHQIEQAYQVACKLCPGVRIKSVGPDGVVFEYPDRAASSEWEGKPFSGESA